MIIYIELKNQIDICINKSWFMKHINAKNDHFQFVGILVDIEHWFMFRENFLPKKASNLTYLILPPFHISFNNPLFQNRTTLLSLGGIINFYFLYKMCIKFFLKFRRTSFFRGKFLFIRSFYNVTVGNQKEFIYLKKIIYKRYFSSPSNVVKCPNAE